MISGKKGNNYLIVAAIAFFASAVLLHRNLEKPYFEVSKQDTAININSTFLSHISLGNKRFISDLFWISTLLESDLEKYQRADLGNWMFLRFKTIAHLDPRFYENYLYGGLYLSIVKDDLEGAAIIYEKGIEQYPDDFSLNLNAGFNYYFELGNYPAGLRLLDRVKYHPKAPVTLPSIVNKLKLETGADPEAIFQLILDRYEKTSDEFLRQKLKGDLYSLRAELDLKCLNEGRIGCPQRDIEGAPYVRQADGTFISARPFRPYRLKKKIIPPK